MQDPVRGIPANADNYKMDHKKRGLACIFNHETFDWLNSTRVGTVKDAEDMEKMLKKLGFDVEVYLDCLYDEVMDTLDSVSKRDHSDHDCLVIAIMTHGESKGKLHAKDTDYDGHELFEKFTGDKCRSLAGKPKLFFIQACKGHMADRGVTIETDGGGPLRGNEKSTIYTIPSHADFLMVYSTVEGFVAFRDTKKGSWFIQTLVDKFENHYKDLDVLTILTLVNRTVAIDYQSKTNSQDTDRGKEMCNFSSTLIRKLYFK